MNYQGQRHSKLVQRKISSSTDADRDFAKVTVNNEGEACGIRRIFVDFHCIILAQILAAYIAVSSPSFYRNANIDFFSLMEM